MPICLWISGCGLRWQSKRDWCLWPAENPRFPGVDRAWCRSIDPPHCTAVLVRTAFGGSGQPLFGPCHLLGHAPCSFVLHAAAALQGQKCCSCKHDAAALWPAIPASHFCGTNAGWPPQARGQALPGLSSAELLLSTGSQSTQAYSKLQVDRRVV